MFYPREGVACQLSGWWVAGLVGFFGRTQIIRFVSGRYHLFVPASFGGWVWMFLFYGEFDPGSGRTLVACLTHASRTVKLSLLGGSVANG